MPAVMEAEADAIDSAVLGVDSAVSLPQKRNPAAHLAAYCFRPGDPANPAKVNPKAHRQPGTRNALSIILDSAPKKAAQYVKSEAPAVLIDSRKWIMPIESDTVGSVADAQPVLAFLAQHLTLIMAQPPSLLMAHSVEAQPGVSATPPTLSLSAGTGGERHPPTPPAGIVIPS